MGERGFGGVFSDEEAVVAQMLLVRSQGVQFARDGFFQICLAKMNGVLDDEGWKVFALAIRDKAAALIEHEVKANVSLSRPPEAREVRLTGDAARLLALLLDATTPEKGGESPSEEGSTPSAAQ